MVSFLRSCAGIILWTFLFQSSLLASELPVKKEASFLPSKLRQKSQPNSAVTNNLHYLVTQERQGERFEIPLEGEFNPSIPVERIEVIEIIADRQEYDSQREVITAEGNVVLRFAQSVMTSDRLEINLSDRLVVAQGNVILERGEQVLRGARFEYYLVADRGVIFNAGGEIYQPSLSRDTDFKQGLAPEYTVWDRALSDRLIVAQPLTDVTATEGIGATIGNTRYIVNGENALAGGTINRLRFEAERVDFETDTWTAENLRLTNDPFSPPELELRADTATYQQVDPLVGNLTTTKSRLVIDDSLAVPLLTNKFVFDGRPSQPGLFNIGFDGEERGGLYIERSWNIIDSNRFSWEITPQYFLQRAITPTTFRFSDDDEGGLLNSAAFGLTSQLDTVFTPRTDLTASFSVTDLDLDNFDDNLRARASLQQRLGKLDNPYRLALEYNFRDRLFNGSLGFQTVRSSFGGVITSPQIGIGNTGITLRYQGSIQSINADTDRQDLLAAERESDRIDLTRYQGAVFLNKNFSIWTGKPLPSTKDGGLRYTPSPVVPYLELFTGVSGVTSFYSNDDSQLSLEGSIGIRGQLGHFSRSWLDYTGFQISYSQNLRGDESPFLFDRLVDRQILSLGITQQIYGPIRFGVQTSLNLTDNDEISTDYLLEYSRRTHNITLRYNPVLEIGSFSLRIADFNWRGNPEPFREQGITPVIQGVD
ncbi:DUF3769 domain-containing protein [Pleurocapsales cyanobacterium LEGE 10410]|nr:DUF3769 domain-containing protein [Pleurocapsales cyanobacterium LEGE 10410]